MLSGQVITIFPRTSYPISSTKIILYYSEKAISLVVINMQYMQHNVIMLLYDVTGVLVFHDPPMYNNNYPFVKHLHALISYGMY